MGETSWKLTAAVFLFAAALSACASNSRQGPVFATTGPVAAAKPDAFAFKHMIRVRELEGLTENVRRNFTVVLRADDFEDSLRRSLANDEMLAPDEPALYELTPWLVDLRAAPVTETVTAAQAIFRYRVTRRDDGAAIFDREVRAEFTSISDPEFRDGGVFRRTLRFVGLGKPSPATLAAGPDETRAPGPDGETAREIHAVRGAIALNIRKAMRQLVAASPGRVTVAPNAADSGNPPPEDAAPDPDGTDGTAGADNSTTNTQSD